MRFTVSSEADTLILPVALDVSAIEVWGIIKDGLSGVWGGVDMRADETDNPAGDGILWPGVVRAGARYLGLIFAHRSHSSAFAEMAARDRIAGLLGHDLTVVFDGPLGRRSIQGFIKVMPEFTHAGNRTCICGVVIVCPDPHWYGLPVEVSGIWGAGADGGLVYPLYGKSGYLEYTGVSTGHRVWVPNAGGRPSWPILRVDGPTSWVRFALGQRVVEVQAQTDGLRIDCRSGAVTSQGVDVGGWLTRDDFFQIPPGGAVVSFQGSDSVEFVVEARPAWL